MAGDREDSSSQNLRPGGKLGAPSAKLDRAQTRKFLEVDSVLQQIKQIQFQQLTGKQSTRSYTSWGRSFSTGLTRASSWSRSVSNLGRSSSRLTGVSNGFGCREVARNVVQHRTFNLTIAFCILLHAVFIGMETEYKDNSSEFSLEWYLAELAFTLIFLIEFALRLVAAKRLRDVFFDGWNVFDFILVTISCVDTFVIAFISRISDQESSLVGAFRAFRLVRVARMVRLLQFFREMWQLVAGIVEAMWTLAWTWVLLLVIIYVCGIFTTRAIGQQYQSEPDLQPYFGNVPRSMFTLFQVTTTDAWADIARKAMRHHVWTAGFFVLYLYVTTCAVLNVVVAVIVENTLDQAVDQRQKFTSNQNKKQQYACAKIYQLFVGMDQNGDGVLTREEFSKAFQDDQVSRYLRQLGIDLRQAEELFSILDFDDSGALDAEEFVGGVLKVIGNGKARDVLALHCDLCRSKKKVDAKIKEIKYRTMNKIDTAAQGVEELRADVLKIANTLAQATGAPPVSPSEVSELPLGRAGFRHYTKSRSKSSAAFSGLPVEYPSGDSEQS